MAFITFRKTIPCLILPNDYNGASAWRVCEWLAASLEMRCIERCCGFDSRALRWKHFGSLRKVLSLANQQVCFKRSPQIVDQFSPRLYPCPGYDLSERCADISLPTNINSFLLSTQDSRTPSTCGFSCGRMEWNWWLNTY